MNINGVKSDEVGLVMLEHKDLWVGEISLIPHKDAEENQKVDFLLFRKGESEHYRLPRLRFDVRENG